MRSDRTFRLKLFGGPELINDRGPVRLAPFEALILAIVASHGGDGIGYRKLLSFAWHQGTEATLRRRLSQHLYSISQRVGGSRLILRLQNKVAIDQSIIRTDLEDFYRYMKYGEPLSAVRILSRGFLTELQSVATHDFDRWLRTQAAAFRTTLTHEAVREWECAVATADWNRAEAAASALHELEPSESHLRDLMTAQAARGHTRRAMRTYNQFAEQASQLDPDWTPEPETGRLRDRLRDLETAPNPQLASEGRDPPRLVGRERELALLMDWLDSRAASGVSHVHVSGARASGRSRLMDEVLRRLSIRGFGVLRAEGSTLDHDLAYATLSRMLPRVVDRELGLLHRPEQPSDGRLDPNAATTCCIPDTTFCNLASTIEHMAQEHGQLAVLVDDVEWADRRSLAVISHASARLSRALVVLTTSCPDRGTILGPVRGAWLPPHVPVLHVRLPPLSPDEIEDVLRTVAQASRVPVRLEDGWIEQVVGLSGGLPGIATDCFKRLLASRSPGEALHLSVLDILNAVGPSTREVLEILAVCERPIPLSVLRSASSLSDAATTTALDQAAAFGLAMLSPRGVATENAELRTIISQATPKGVRLAIHERIAQGLVDAKQPSFAGRVAHHLLEAGDALEAKPYVLRGARQAIGMGHWEEARELLVSFLSAAMPGSQCGYGEAAGLLGRVLTLIGRLEDAEASWARAEHTYWHVGDPAAALDARLERLAVRHLQGEHQAARLLSRTQALDAEAEDRGLPRVSAKCMALEIRLLESLRRTEELPNLVEKALRRARSQESSVALQFLTVSLHSAVFGSPQRASEVAEATYDWAAHLTDSEMALQALNWWIIACYREARLNSREGRGLIARATDMASGSTNIEQRFKLEANLGVWHLDAGDLAAAERAFDRAALMIQALSAPPLRRNLLMNRAQLALESKNYQAARMLFREALDAGANAHESARCVAKAGLGLAELALGNLDRARGIYSELPEMPDQWTYDPFLWLVLRARLDTIAGDGEKALELLREQETTLEEAFPIIWTRVRLLRFDLGVRMGRSPRLDEKEQLERFLQDRGMGRRRSQLERLGAKATVR